MKATRALIVKYFSYTFRDIDDLIIDDFVEVAGAAWFMYDLEHVSKKSQRKRLR